MSIAPNRRKWLRHGPLACGLAAVVLGAAGVSPSLAGRAAPWLSTNPAVALVGLGLALLCARSRATGAAFVAASIALTASVGTLVHRPGPPIASAAGAVLVALGILATLARTPDILPETLGVLALATCLFAISGHVHAPALALVDGDAPSVVAAVGLAFAAAGLLLLHPRSRLVSILSHDGPSGSLVRRHFAAASLAPLAFAWGVSAAHRAGLLDARAATATLVVATTLALLAATRLGARAAFLGERAHARAAGERAARAQAERTAERLERQGEALREALGLRDEFLTVAAHELRTPLTVVALNVQALGRNGAPFDAGTHRRIHAVRAQLARMERMIDDLLDASRLADGDLAVRADDTDLAEVVRGVARGRRDELQASGSTLSVEAEEVQGAWDRDRLAQVVDRVLDNAIKYGGGHPIEIRVVRDGTDAVVEIRDHGIGIDPERRKRLFERYGRAVSERHYGGFGLGLWSARRWICAMGGRIEVESELGAGTTVRITLPADSRRASRRVVGARCG